MRMLLVSLALCVGLPLAAQESEFPTLAALADVDVPAFQFVEMVGRMSSEDTHFTPPAEPARYEIGQRDSLRLAFGEERERQYMEVELRGQTDDVLVWIHIDIDYPQWRAQALARNISANVLGPMQRLFQSEEPPGVDGDPRLHVAIIDDPEGNVMRYFSRTSTRPQDLWPKINEREMVVIDVSFDDEYTFFDDIMLETIAHDYLLLLQHHVDPGEDTWLKEAMASYAGHRVADPLFRIHRAHAIADEYLEAPGVGLTQWESTRDKGPKYGAGVLFMIYLAQRFGDGIMARLLAEPSDGWRAVDKTLREDHDVSADEVFADWVLANYFLHARRGYGYREMEEELTRPQPRAATNRFPSARRGRLPQYGTDYIAVNVGGGGKLTLSLREAPEAELVDVAPTEGERFYFGLASDGGNPRLTRAFDLSGVDDAQLRFKIWYDLDHDQEYGYVNISDDGGENWQTLPGNYTERSGIYSRYYDEGYTGDNGIWLTERMDLSDYAPGQVLISFEIVSHIGTAYGGMAIDGLRIDAIGFQDGFETDDDAWIAEGWIRSDNRLPNNIWLQAVQATRGHLHVSRSLVRGSGDLQVDILPGVSQVLVAISPVVPQTNQSSPYRLELNLFDAAGAPMDAASECQLRTTTGLNFRDAPGGDKLGLLPVGSVVFALDRRDGWFNVEYDGSSGWIHGDYVTTEDSCDF